MIFIRAIYPNPAAFLLIRIGLMILFCWQGFTILSGQAQSLKGSWKGYLSQVNRPYGFHYSIELQEGGVGYSRIVSEGGGGEAQMTLRWSYDTLHQTIHLTEEEVSQKTVPDWKWCLKTATLSLRMDGTGSMLEGNWTGRIEGRVDKAGVCAPGEIYLQKIEFPTLATPKAEALKPKDSTVLGRMVDIQHIIEVARPDIRIRIWDNGVPDGDIVTVLLDEQIIAHKLRVNKRPYAFPIKLTKSVHVLVLHADSLGSLPPNTVAISVDDGIKEKVIVVRADIRESGGILIRQFVNKGN
jgi:hypothetical protein